MDDSLLDTLRRRKTLRFDDAADPRTLVVGEIAKVVGNVRPAEEPWIAPFSGRPCVAFTVRALTSRDDLIYRPSQIERSHDFWLDGAEGPVWVQPSGWCRYLVTPWHGHRSDPSTGRRFDSFTERYGVHYRESLAGFFDDLTVLERVVEVSQRIAAVGLVGEPHFPASADRRGGGYRQRARYSSLAPPDTGRLWLSSYEAHVGRGPPT